MYCKLGQVGVALVMVLILTVLSGCGGGGHGAFFMPDSDVDFGGMVLQNDNPGKALLKNADTGIYGEGLDGDNVNGLVIVLLKNGVDELDRDTIQNGQYSLSFDPDQLVEGNTLTVELRNTDGDTLAILPFMPLTFTSGTDLTFNIEYRPTIDDPNNPGLGGLVGYLGLPNDIDITLDNAVDSDGDGTPDTRGARINYPDNFIQFDRDFDGVFGETTDTVLLGVSPNLFDDDLSDGYQNDEDLRELSVEDIQDVIGTVEVTYNPASVEGNMDDLFYAPVQITVHRAGSDSLFGASLTITPSVGTINNQAQLNPTLDPNDPRITIHSDGSAVIQLLHELPANTTGTATCTVSALNGSDDVMATVTILTPGSLPNDPPVLTNVNPDEGLSIGGTEVTLTGTGFSANAIVLFGSIPALDVDVLSATEIECLAPENHNDEIVDVRVINTDGQSSLLEDAFTYIPAPIIHNMGGNSGPTLGSFNGLPQFNINGNFFQNGARVFFGQTEAENVVYVSTTKLQCIPPAHEAGIVGITVLNPDGQAGLLDQWYQYVPYALVSELTSLDPGGSTAGMIDDSVHALSFEVAAHDDDLLINNMVFQLNGDAIDLDALDNTSFFLLYHGANDNLDSTSHAVLGSDDSVLLGPVFVNQNQLLTFTFSGNGHSIPDNTHQRFSIFARFNADESFNDLPDMGDELILCTDSFTMSGFQVDDGDIVTGDGEIGTGVEVVGGVLIEAAPHNSQDSIFNTLATAVVDTNFALRITTFGENAEVTATSLTFGGTQNLTSGNVQVFLGFDFDEDGVIDDAFGSSQSIAGSTITLDPVSSFLLNTGNSSDVVLQLAFSSSASGGNTLISNFGVSNLFTAIGAVSSNALPVFVNGDGDSNYNEGNPDTITGGTITIAGVFRDLNFQSQASSVEVTACDENFNLGRLQMRSYHESIDVTQIVLAESDQSENTLDLRSTTQGGDVEDNGVKLWRDTGDQSFSANDDILIATGNFDGADGSIVFSGSLGTASTSSTMYFFFTVSLNGHADVGEVLQMELDGSLVHGTGSVSGAEIEGETGVFIGDAYAVSWYYIWAPEYEMGTGCQNIAAGDFDVDGDLDLVTANTDENTVTIAEQTGLQNGFPLYDNQVDYAVGTEPLGIAVGDVNNDGAPDILVSNSGSNTISVLINTGSGAMNAALNYNADNSPGWGLVMADFDHDGDRDVAVCNHSTTHVSILLNNGSGVFGAPTTYEVQGEPLALAIGDFNGNGDLDLAIGIAGMGVENLSVILGNGDGTFGASVLYGTGTTCFGVAAGDIDRDGKLDLVATDPVEAKVSVLLGNGNGTFGTATDIPLGEVPVGVRIGDINLDGTLDLAITDVGESRLHILSGRGDGTFGTPYSKQISIDGDVGPRYLVMADLNRDGFLDLATANENNGKMSVITNRACGGGNGLFDTAVSSATGTDPRSIVTGDFDRDGKLDAITANFDSDNVSFLKGNGNGGFNAPVNFNVTSGDHPLSINAGDWDLDGDLDIAVGTGATLRILFNDGNASFGSMAGNAIGSIQTAIATDDLDRDGDLDIAVPMANTNQIGVLLNNGNGTFASVATYNVGSNPESIQVGDMDQDGNLDLVAGFSDSTNFSILYGNGDGTFDPAVNRGDTYSHFVQVLDFDRDGKLDVVTMDRSNEVLSLWTNNGDGTFDELLIESSLDYFSVAIGDFNADGNPDLVMGDVLNRASVLLGNGDGTFTTATRYSVGSGPASLCVGDFNQDGALDVVTANANSDNVSILMGKK